MSITRMDELEAVNVMLGAIFEQPVTTLNNNGLVDATDALNLLRKTSRTIQMKGYPFNTSKERTLVQDTDGFINIPSNTLKVDTTGIHKSRDVVQRGLRLFDRDNDTFLFDQGLIVELVSGLDFDDLPIAAQNAITMKASRLFQADKLGSIDQGRVDLQDEHEAMAALEDAEGDSADYNIL